MDKGRDSRGLNEEKKAGWRGDGEVKDGGKETEFWLC